MQSFMLSDPVKAFVDACGGQSSGVAWFVLSQYLSAGHAGHVVSAEAVHSVVLYVPGAQSEQGFCVPSPGQ